MRFQQVRAPDGPARRPPWFSLRRKPDAGSPRDDKLFAGETGGRAAVRQYTHPVREPARLAAQSRPVRDGRTGRAFLRRVQPQRSGHRVRITRNRLTNAPRYSNPEHRQRNPQPSGRAVDGVCRQYLRFGKRRNATCAVSQALGDVKIYRPLWGKANKNRGAWGPKAGRKAEARARSVIARWIHQNAAVLTIASELDRRQGPGSDTGPLTPRPPRRSHLAGGLARRVPGRTKHRAGNDTEPSPSGLHVIPAPPYGGPAVQRLREVRELTLKAEPT